MKYEKIARQVLYYLRFYLGCVLSTLGDLLLRQPVLAVKEAKGIPSYDGGQPGSLGVHEKDANTPDCWVPRSPQVVRLTGRHPLNCEPPMAKLLDDFITPASLSFVRNHGAVPKLSWRTHRIKVNGLVENPLLLSMDEILQLPPVTIPVTLSCAGNRRSEENSVKRTLGFGWGPCATCKYGCVACSLMSGIVLILIIGLFGLACSTFTGARLSDVLKMANVRSVEQGARYVRYAGPDGELPQGDDGSYGTSIPLAHALEEANDVLIVYKANGEWLLPDHGYPVRMVVPGFIAARSVKWLSEITVSREESDNFYHYHDNKVLPPHVDERLAREEGWWYKSDFIINELNTNSVIVSPGHDEFLSLRTNRMYVIKGYAQTGGGRKIIRVEVSRDDGETWMQADIRRFEKPRPSGRLWCWVLWDIELEVKHLMCTKELLVRAWDSTQTNQPAKITWNVMGMMNNSYFRVRIHKHLKDDGEIGLRFQHPSPIEKGQFSSQGWRDDEKMLQAPSPEFIREWLQKRKELALCRWSRIAMVTAWCVGGLKKVRSTAEKKKSKNDFQSPNQVPGEVEKIVEDPPVALDRRKKTAFEVVEKIVLTRDTIKLRFALQSPQHILGLPVGNHMFFYADIDGVPVMRAYTPTSSNSMKGCFELVVKVYYPKEHPRFPNGGIMSQYFDRLKIGDKVDVKGPAGHFEYTGPGRCLDNRKPHSFKKFVMIAGGTGISPLYQIAHHILSDPEDSTEITLVYANRTEKDILLREELDTWAAEHESFKVWYTIDHPYPGWKYGRGHIDCDLLKEVLPPADEESIVSLCGPPGMIEHACIPNLEILGWRRQRIVVF